MDAIFFKKGVSSLLEIEFRRERETDLKFGNMDVIFNIIKKVL